MNSLRKVTSWMIWKAREVSGKKYNTASEGKPVILMLWLFPQQSAVSCLKLSQLLLCRGQRCQRLVSAVSAWQYCTIRIFGANNVIFLIFSVLYHFSYRLVLFMRSVPGLFEPGTIGTNKMINCPTVCFVLFWLYDLHKFINTNW